MGNQVRRICLCSTWTRYFVSWRKFLWRPLSETALERPTILALQQTQLYLYTSARLHNVMRNRNFFASAILNCTLYRAIFAWPGCFDWYSIWIESSITHALVFILRVLLCATPWKPKHTFYIVFYIPNKGLPCGHPLRVFRPPRLHSEWAWKKSSK